MIVLDASVLIGHLDPADVHHPRATELLLANEREEFAASPVTLAEVLVGPVRAGLAATAQASLLRLRVTTVPFPEDGPIRLAQLRVQTGLRLADCCVLLAAAGGLATVLTFDSALAAAAQRLGHEVRG